MRWHVLVRPSEDHRYAIDTYEGRKWRDTTFIYKGGIFRKMSKKTYHSAEERAKAMQKYLNQMERKRRR